MTKPEDHPTRFRSFEELTAQIAARLRIVCTSMPDDDFAALVTDIARMKLKFADIDARFGSAVDPVDRQSEHRLAEELDRSRASET